jgi:putative Holliday junction resolvase
VRVLGIDYGERRIGLALSDATGLLASPWKTIPHDGRLETAVVRLLGEVRLLAQEADGLSAVVIGFPRRLSGEPTGLTERVQTLTTRLREAAGVPVVLQDERLTSREAEEVLARRERDWRRRKARLDAMAATIVLQDYLDGLDRHAGAAGRDAS